MSDTDLKVTLTHPCAKCPFRAEFKGERDFLREGRRAGIVESIHEGAEFPCHNTTIESDDGFERLATSDSLTCAGLALVMLRADFPPPGVLKFAERLGNFDAEAFLAANADVETWSYHECVDDAPEIETCSVVGPTCEAPAGFLVGGGVVRGTVAAEEECDECGCPVCSACMTDGICHDCKPPEDDDVDS